MGNIDTIDDDSENDSVSNTDNVVDSPPVLTRPHRNTRLPDCYQDFNMNGMPDLHMQNLNRVLCKSISCNGK